MPSHVAADSRFRRAAASDAVAVFSPRRQSRCLPARPLSAFSTLLDYFASCITDIFAASFLDDI
jgi:hypothetical protein